jgi:nitrogen regulatory protein PII-like uncharacterized protein
MNKSLIKVRAYSTTFFVDYPKNEDISIEKAEEYVRKKVTHSAQVVSIIEENQYTDFEHLNPNFKDPEKFEILNLDISKYKKQTTN